MRKRLSILLAVIILCTIIPFSVSASSWEDRLEEEYQAGYEFGYESAVDERVGFQEGYEEGYNDGYYDAENYWKEEYRQLESKAEEDLKRESNSIYFLIAVIGFLIYGVVKKKQ